MTDLLFTLYPWVKTEMKRSTGWHELTFRDDGEVLTMSIDGTVVGSSTSRALLDKVYDPLE